MSSKRINVAKGGNPRMFRSNQLTDVRIAWACRVAIEHLQEPASPATIIRRALELYQQHLEHILNEPPQSSKKRAECVRLAAANKNSRSDVSEFEVESGRLQSLCEMQSEKRASKPRLIDQIEETLARWNKHEKKKEERLLNGEPQKGSPA